MAEPTTSATPADVDKPKGWNKYVKRFSSILRRSRHERTASRSATNEPALVDPESTAGPASSEPAPAATTVTSDPPVETPHPPTKEVSKDPNKTHVDSVNQTRQDRARALFAKYGLTLDESEWLTPAREPVERVEKPIRMRVRRQCHRCQVTFGGGQKVCSNCQHVRCKKCPRLPHRKSKAGVQPTRSGAKDGESTLETTDNATTEGKLRRRARVGAMPVPRVSGFVCHECSTSFPKNSSVCPSCHHSRCRDCPRESIRPDETAEYGVDDGPPVNRPVRQWKKVRLRVRWTCHQCSSQFLHGSKTCFNCNHERCDSCTRQPPKRVKPPPDPDLVRRVEEKLAMLNISERAVEGTARVGAS